MPAKKSPSKKPSAKPTTLAAYERALPAPYRSLAKKLRTELDTTLPETTSKLWHGHPVWFQGEHPIVGYSLTAKNGISLLFWNGQAFKEPKLQKVGSFKAAQMLFKESDDLPVALLRRLFKRASREIWDYRGLGRK